ncbi:MAG TPA: glycosyltransferase family 2 protein [Anaerolineales bacterium]|nr:glycosyltransferase family 2 protein [Anaerolineales bacterium]
MYHDLSLEDPFDVSVIICAYTEDRWAELVSAVESLKHQTKQPCEIILSIDHNPSLYRHACEYFPPEIQTIQNSGPKGLSGARNSGIAASKGNIIAFLDDDATAASDWLSLLCGYFRSSNVLGVGGSVQPEWQSKKASWFPEEFLWVLGCTYKGLPEGAAIIRNPMGGCMCWRREVFSIAGGFRNGIGRIGKIPLGCEETELCIRAHQKWPDRVFLFEPQSKIYHHIPAHRATFSYFLSRCYAEGISKAYISRFVGKVDGLSSERTYTFHVLPAGVLRGLTDSLRGDISGIARSMSISMGFLSTLLGYLAGSLLLFRSSANKFDLNVNSI